MLLESRPSGPLTGRVRPPGDKSISHRALILGALADGTTDIEGLLEGDDVLRTAAAMRAFGAEATQLGEGRWRVAGTGGGFSEPAAPVDFGNSGTGVRLTIGAAARFPINIIYTGDASLSSRPMGRILAPLTAMGAAALARTGERLPAAVRGGRLQAIRHESPKASAQIKSAVLLAGLGAEGRTEVVEPEASRDHTERMLAAFGANVETGALADGRNWAAVEGGARLHGCAVRVPADPSSAAFAAAAALILPGSEILIDQVCLNPLRAGFFETIADMGADCAALERGELGGEPVATLRVQGSILTAARPPAGRAASMIDEYPILAALAAFAEGETRLVGAEELRVKESDRIALMVAGLRACGVEAEELPDGLIVRGCGQSGVRGGALIDTHGDHRIAMSFLVLGLGAREPVRVKDADMIATSFPGFAAFMGGLGADIRTV